MRTWLRNMGDLGSDRLAIASYVQEGDFEGALALARALLEETSHEGGTRYRCPELPKIAEKGKGSANTEEHEAADFKVTVTPNPATTQVSVEYSSWKATAAARSLTCTNCLQGFISSSSRNRTGDVALESW